ncbi:MAG: efflux RND transporter periplasmic adaptor subunit, partial [Myxococcales bacterium]|nr:efflux RND transporter periplasmic adaptor subunit [Myxococcales bacterium]
RLEQAQVELRAAERELKRAKAVGDAIAESNLDAAETRHAAAKAAVATARVGVARAAIRAPFAGTVASVAVEQGEVAPPGSPVVRLVQLDPIKVKVNVSDREVVALKEGMDAHVSTGAQSKDFMGKITHINPAADLRTRSFEVDVEVPNPDHLLRPGMIATVRVSEEVVSSDLIIPQDWVVTRLDGIGVFVEKDGVARWQPIVLGDVVREQVVVKEGIAPDTRVIYKGHRELVDGDRVLVARSGVCCTEGRIQYP